MLHELGLWLIPVLISVYLIQQYALLLVGAFVCYFVTMRLLEKWRLGKLDEKPVLITGCDSGFGHGLALKCLGEGMPVFAACYDENGCNRLRDEARKLSAEDRLVAFPMDVRSDESVQKARALVESKLSGYKGLWGLVNNAGIGDARGWSDWVSTKDYQRMWDVNTLGVIRTTNAFMNLIKRTRGRIVNVGSITSKFPMPTIGPYSVSKMAVVAYSDIIRAELIQWGITVCVLEPGFFKTPQANPNASNEDCARVWAAIKDEYGNDYFTWTQSLITGYLDYKCKPGGVPLVVEAYFNALTSRVPRLRAQIGLDSTFQFNTLAYLPTRFNHLLCQAYWKIFARPPATKIVY